jgi:hypothetical protein
MPRFHRPGRRILFLILCREAVIRYDIGRLDAKVRRSPFAEHLPHGPDTHSAQLAKNRIGKDGLFMIALCHGRSVAAGEGLIETMD